jgi:hypothetical protein
MTKYRVHFEIEVDVDADERGWAEEIAHRQIDVDDLYCTYVEEVD